VVAGDTPVLVHNSNCGGQVEYGSTDLSQKTIQERLRLGKRNGNFAAARIVDSSGNERIEVAFASKGLGNHAERKLLQTPLAEDESITEIYSERQACTGSNGCRSMLGGIAHTWSFPWETSGTQMAGGQHCGTFG
jgi:hypothetical protein